MKPVSPSRIRLLAAALAAGIAFTPAARAAGERESLEMLRETTLNLINVLVEQGVMSKEKADALVKAAQQKAAQTVAALPQEERPAAEAKPRIRVPYVPEVVKKELRDEIRQEVLAQAKAERWGDPGALPDWVGRIKWEGDVRLRYQSDMMGKGNAPASDYVGAAAAILPSTTRIADFSGTRGGTVATANTLEDRERVRLRARLGMSAKVSDDFIFGARLATGSATDRVSTNQTLGQDFNKYTFSLDRAYLKYEPNDWLSVSGGRIPNPWFSTDLVWDENLNFEGVAATLGSRHGVDAFKPFLTVGVFPIRESNPPTRNGRMLEGAQTGFQWDWAQSSFKLGAAFYAFNNFEGHPETDASFLTAASYGRYEYEAGLRQKGNTLFRTNAPSDIPGAGVSNTIWGLASRFREVNLTAMLDLGQWDPVHAILIGDYVRNIGFKRPEIYARTGLTSADMPDGSNSGFQVKLQVGMPKVVERDDWAAYVAFRRVGSDAVLDAFTSSDFGLGGTNNKGYILGFNYGVDRNVNLGVRWLSADSLHSTIPIAASGGFSTTNPKFSVDQLQVDLSAAF